MLKSTMRAVKDRLKKEAQGGTTANSESVVVNNKTSVAAEKTSAKADIVTAAARTDPDIKIPAPDPVQAIPAASHAPMILPSFSLEGKVALITGGARGLGYAMAQALLSSGADLAILDLPSAHASTVPTTLLAHFKTAHPHAPRTPKITFHPTDVTSETQVTASFTSIISAHGKADILITSAGICENIPAESYSAASLTRILSINVTGTFLLATEMSRWCFSHSHPASMIFIGSMSGSIVNIPQPQAPYNASKAAVRQMAASLAVEWAQRGVRVNVISPGYMVTELTERILEKEPELGERWRGLTPMGRLGRPEDLGGVVVWLASEASAFVTGAEIRVDGGYTLV